MREVTNFAKFVTSLCFLGKGENKFRVFFLFIGFQNFRTFTILNHINPIICTFSTKSVIFVIVVTTIWRLNKLMNIEMNSATHACQMMHIWKMKWIICYFTWFVENERRERWTVRHKYLAGGHLTKIWIKHRVGHTLRFKVFMVRLQSSPVFLHGPWSCAPCIQTVL